MRPHHHDHDDPFDQGLAVDLQRMLSRRNVLALLAGAGATAVLAACGSDSSSSSTATAGTTATTGSTADAGSTSVTSATSASCEPIPEETAGPYPGDGSNGPNVLTEADVVRSDIRSSVGSASGTAEGVPTTFELTVTDTANACAPLAGAAVYLWHCDRDGGYSMYSEGVEDENYLRGVQETDADGKLTFTSIFPACYSGRWPHAHFEVYASVADATGGGEPIATSQLALPQDVCEAVYATDGYEQSVQNLSGVSLDSDNVFGEDGAAQQVPTVSGDVTAGYTASLTFAV